MSSDVDPDPVGAAAFGMSSRIRIAKKQSKSRETHLKIDQNHQNIIFLK